MNVPRRQPSAFGMPAKLALIILLSLFPAFVALTVLQLWLFRKNLEQTIFTEQTLLTTSVAKEVDQQLVTLKNALIGSARAITKEDIATSEAAQAYLDTNVGLNLLFERSTFLFSPTGRLIAEHPYLPNRRGQDFSWRDYIKDTVRTQASVISPPFVTTKDDHNAVIMFATPVFSKDGNNIIAINTGSVGLTRPLLLGNIAKTVIGKTGFMYIVSADGKLIMHPDKSLLLTRPYKGGANPLFDNALKGFEGSGRTIERDGRNAISSFKRLPSTGWVLVTVYPADEAFEAFDALVRRLALICTITIAAVCFLVWIRTKGLVSGIQAKNGILKKLRAESLEKLHAGNQFFREASHDFKQRLHGMQLLINAAERDMTGSAAPALSKVKSAVADLQTYLDNFLVITRLETALIRINPERLALQDVFQDLELQFEQYAFSKGTALKFRFTRLEVVTDRALLIRILDNLISNAIKFSRDKVLIGARMRGGAVSLFVIDNGLGVSDSDKADIFKPFYQVAASNERCKMAAGHGLGLSIVKRASEMIGARIEFTSRVHCGTAAVLILNTASIPP
jgi:signal transduction histidine kinase